MTTTYRNFKKSLIRSFEIFEFLCCVRNASEYYSAGHVRTERILVCFIVEHCRFDLNSL